MEKGTFEEVNITTTGERVEVSLESHQYRLERLEQYHFFLSPKRNLLAGKINKTTENTLIIQYQKSKYSQSLTQIIKKSDDFERLLIAQKITRLADFMNSPIQPFLHPDNLFLLGEEIMIAHRGFMQEVVPYVLEENDFLKQYRMLVFAILYPGINSENLFNG